MENIRHLGLVVVDLERALAFYRDLLGLHIQGKTDEKGSFISKILATKNVEVKTVKLSADDNSTRIELLKFNNSKTKKKISLVEPGFTHIALTVKNLDELYLKLKKAKIKFNCSPTITPNGTIKILFCEDFEGNYLELIEEIVEKKLS